MQILKFILALMILHTTSWAATNTTGAPAAWSNHSAIWTGTHMIVWAGVGNTSWLNTGGRYTP